MNKYLYGILSSIRASGRLIWPIYYLIFIIGIVSIFKYSLNKKKSLLIISILVTFQIVDLSPGISALPDKENFFILNLLSKVNCLREFFLNTNINNC